MALLFFDVSKNTCTLSRAGSKYFDASMAVRTRVWTVRKRRAGSCVQGLLLNVSGWMFGMSLAFVMYVTSGRDQDHNPSRVTEYAPALNGNGKRRRKLDVETLCKGSKDICHIQVF
jgi:hypothetical protein